MSAVLKVTGIDALDLLRICADKLNNTEATDLLFADSDVWGWSTDRKLHPCPGRYRDVQGNCKDIEKGIVKKATTIVQTISQQYHPNVRRERLLLGSTLNESLQTDVYLVDNEAARQLSNVEGSTTTSTLLPFDAFSDTRVAKRDGKDVKIAHLPEEDVPFVGGNIVMNHADTLEAIINPNQKRDGDSFNRQPGQFNSPTVGSPHGR